MSGAGRSSTATVMTMPRLIAATDDARRLAEEVDAQAGEWVIVNWRECARTTQGFVAALERHLYDRGFLVAHAHRPPTDEGSSS